MIVLYSIVCAIIVFILDPVTDSSPIIEDVTPSEVEELYQKFIAVLDSTYEATNSSVAKNQSNVEDAVTQALYNAEYYLFTELTTYNWDDFEAIINQAFAQESNYERCDRYISKFSTLTDVYYPGLVTCINTTGEEAQSIFQQNIATIKDLCTNIPNITAEIDSCTSTNQTCLNQISSEISQLNSTIPQEMVAISSKSNSTAGEYLIKVQDCTDHSRKALKVMARTLTLEYMECTGLTDEDFVL